MGKAANFIVTSWNRKNQDGTALICDISKSRLIPSKDQTQDPQFKTELDMGIMIPLDVCATLSWTDIRSRATGQVIGRKALIRAHVELNFDKDGRPWLNGKYGVPYMTEEGRRFKYVDRNEDGTYPAGAQLLIFPRQSWDEYQAQKVATEVIPEKRVAVPVPTPVAPTPSDAGKTLAKLAVAAKKAAKMAEVVVDEEDDTAF